jgi:hypothetical protein
MTRSERLALVDHDEPALPVVAQCQLLKVARSTLLAGCKFCFLSNPMYYMR